jgi:shikimate kinase
MGVRAIFLVGFMGSGKSSVGQELARRLRWDFLDLDARIESREGRTIPEIFRDHGEPGFRLVETAALCELTESLERDTIVALGGGAFAQEKNRALMRHWPTVFLEAPIDELWRRSSEGNDTRPLRKDREQFARLYAERLPSYRQAAVAVETAGKDLVSICAEIESALQQATVKADSSLDLSASSKTGGLR